jgi:hypothetical protein
MARDYQNLETQRLHDKNKAAKTASAAPKFGEAEDKETQGALEHLHAAHGEHAENAVKSAHIYQHEGGVHHLHTHDHQSGAHEHTEHASHHEALAAAKEHLGGAPEHEKLEQEGIDKFAEAGHVAGLSE